MAKMQICDADLNGRRIVFLCDRLAVLNGAVTEAQIPLKEFFVPIDTYNTLTITLKKASITEFDFCNIGEGGKVKFLFLYPQYNLDMLQSDRILYWSYEPITVEGTQGPQSTALQYDWKPFGNLHVMSGNGDNLVEPIWLMNDSDEYDIPVIALVAY